MLFKRDFFLNGLIKLVLCGLSLFQINNYAFSASFVENLFQVENNITAETTDFKELKELSPLPIKIKSEKNQKIIAAILACPLPFGWVGAHRIYLGAKPIVPIVYIATFGGCFGILPFIDFVVLLTNKNLEKYENNSKIFMWVK